MQELGFRFYFHALRLRFHAIRLRFQAINFLFLAIKKFILAIRIRLHALADFLYMLADFLHLISDFLYTILCCALGFCGAGGWAGGAGERFLTVRRQKKSGLRFSARAGGDFVMHVQT